MKKIGFIISIIFCLSIHLATGQAYVPSNHGYTFKKANKLFEDYAYKDALGLYEQLLAAKYDKPEVKLQIAECYRELNDPRKAVFYYSKVVDNQEVAEPIHNFHYATSLYQIGHYEKAQELLVKYQRQSPDDERAQKIVEAIKNYHTFFQDSSLYIIGELTINSSESDFGPAYYNGGLVFASARKDPTNLAKQKYKRDNSAFLDLYFAKIKADCTMSSVGKFNPHVNTKFHESSTTFYDDGRKVLFTRNNYFEKKILKSSSGDVNLKVFQAEQGPNGNWVNIQGLPFNSDEYSTGHPTITADGKRIYFISDMPGGQGGPDIYYTDRQNGTWGEPQNLGQQVNTKGRELFPFVFEDKFLYFASNGHLGMGGLDIYQLDLTTHELINLGYPINTNWDDFGLIRNKGGHSGFFSSNRTGGKGNDDIYRFDHVFVNLEVIVVDAENDTPIPEAHLILFENDQVIRDLVTDIDGKIEIKVATNKDYEIKVVKNNCLTLNRDFSTQSNLPGDSEKLVLPLKRFVELKGLAYDAETMELLPGTHISAVNELTGEEQVERADEQGEFVLKLFPSERYSLVGKFEDKVDMIVGYVPCNTDQESIKLHLEPKLLDVGEEQLSTIGDKAKTTLLGKGVRITGPIEIENIYYQFDRWEIMKEATPALDKIIEVMNDNSSIVIELSSHTDARGPDSYNQSLSEKRAKSVVEYIVSGGIYAKRLVAKGYGESKLLNECLEKSDCSEEQHQENRRTEFMVLEF